MNSFRPQGHVPPLSGSGVGCSLQLAYLRVGTGDGVKGNKCPVVSQQEGRQGSQGGVDSMGEVPPSLLPAERLRSWAHLCHPARLTWRASCRRHSERPLLGA